jgi:dienelactone hydrolase
VVHVASLPHPLLVRPHPPRVIGAVGRVIGSGLDGLLVGLAVGYVLLTALGAPANHIGVPPIVAIVVVGAAVSAVAALGAGVGRLTAAILRVVGRRVERPLARRVHARSATIVGWPFRFVSGLPLALIGAFGILLWVALAGGAVGPLGLLTPPGILSTFVYLCGLVGALLNMGRVLAAPTRDDPPRRPGPKRQSLSVAVTLGAGLVVIWSAAFAAYPGSTAGLVAYDPTFDGDPATVETALGTLAGGTWAPVDDPGEPGTFAIERSSYGSGTDVHRPAFGAEADLRTPTVDASDILPPLDGDADGMRAAWWGFGTDALPLNALVWSPVGQGPFPLVLIVHGNHAMGDFSEDGYAYLGEHLATRGFIVASVDEDFLNGSWAGDWGGEEQLARAWLLLLHADQWRSRSSDPADPFFGRVDVDRIALIGHSRGGEAASVAAMLAGRSTPPRASMRPWPTGLDISAVVSIAPSDGQYRGSVLLQGVDFLTLAGGHDADARAWSGIRQYARTTPTGDSFRAALWSYRANHGQFNTVWGRSDFGPYGGAQLNLAPLLPAAEQEDVARTAIGAFLEASLHGRAAYRGFFARPMLGRDWLPQDIVLVRSGDAGTLDLSTRAPDEPIDGVTIVEQDFANTARTFVPLRALQHDQGDLAILGEWTAGTGDAVWGMDGLDRVAHPTAATTLRFALADGSDLDAGAPGVALEVVVEAVDRDGDSARLPLAAVGALPPPMPVTLAKDDRLVATTSIELHLDSPVERVLQTYAIPLALFEAADPTFTAADLSGFRLRFPRAADGAVWIDDVGLGGQEAFGG